MRPLALLFAAILTLTASLSAVAGDAPEHPAGDTSGKPCKECHKSEDVQFSHSTMAKSATSPGFLAEWSKKGKPKECLSCHAPSGAQGIVCQDCHKEEKHPYRMVPVKEGCGACHNAPGEETVKTYLQSQSAKEGRLCADCHTHSPGGRFSHDFRGPSKKGFLYGAAWMRVIMRSANGALGGAIQVRHRAGHALPGGTTGRSVWLVARGLDADGGEVWRRTSRFGWEHSSDGGWIDHTLMPGKSAVISLADLKQGGATRLNAELLYRFEPGTLDVPDPRQQTLDKVEMDLP